MANVANDADDLIGLVPDSGPDDQSLAQCFLVREDAVDESLTDDDRLVALAHFLLSKVPSAPQRDSHRAEVVFIHAAKVNKSYIRRGRSVIKPTASTPGKPATRVSSCSKKSDAFSGVLYFCRGKSTRRVKTLFGSNPGSTFCSATKLRIRSPAAINNITAI